VTSPPATTVPETPTTAAVMTAPKSTVPPAAAPTAPPTTVAPKTPASGATWSDEFNGPLDTSMWRRAMLCTLRDLSALDAAAFGIYSTAWSLVEEL